MRDRWERGQPRPLESYLAEPEFPHHNPELLLDLIYGEFALREQAGEMPRLDEYQTRFPELRERLARQIHLHEALSQASTRGSPSNSKSENAAPTPAVANPISAVAPDRIGKYRIIAQLGAGGQATVYRAVHPTLSLDLAIKVSHQPLPTPGTEADTEPNMARRLASEGRILAELRHPNLARVFDLDLHEGHPFVAMEFVPGRSLEQFTRQSHPQPIDAARIVSQIARAVEHAHSKGIGHLDIKPANVLVADDGTPRLIDFGLSRLHHPWTEPPLESGTVSGTLAYMAPERAAGAKVESHERVDVFGLGGLLYYLLTGRAPFSGRDPWDVWSRVRTGSWDREPLEHPHIPASLRKICQQCMATDPAQRYGSAEAVADALDKFSSQNQGRRRTALIAVVAGVSLIAALIVGLDWWKRPATKTPLPLAPISVTRFPSRLTVRVWNGNRFSELARAVPLKTGDQLRVEAEYPAELYTTMLWIDAEGTVRQLAVGKPNAVLPRLLYPVAGQAVPLEGRSGTQLILLCGNPNQPVSLEQIQGRLQDVRNWPVLPPASILRHDSTGLQIENFSRGLGQPRDKPDPESEVVSRFRKLQSDLGPHCVILSAIAVSQQ